MVAANAHFGDVGHDRLSVCHKTSRWLVRVLHCKSGESRTARRWLMADRRTAAPATAHGVARRLLVFKLPDQLALCFAESAGDVRVLSDRYKRRTTGQARTQSDALLFASAVLQ